MNNKIIVTPKVSYIYDDRSKSDTIYYVDSIEAVTSKVILAQVKFENDYVPVMIDREKGDIAAFECFTFGWMIKEK